MNMLKRFAALAGILALLLTVGGCKEQPEHGEEQTQKPFDPEISQLLWDADWVRYDFNIGEDVLIRFGEDGSYVYRCDCGEPVGNSDIYDSYSYDPEERVITLQGGGRRDWIQVLYLDNSYLCLQFSDGTVAFRNRNTKIDDSVRDCARQYIPSDAILCLTVLGYEDGLLTVAPYEYDADAASQWDSMVTTLPAADDIAFTSISITVEGEQEEMLAVTLPESDRTHVGEFYTSGFLKLDKNGIVTGVYFYGETIICQS